MRTKPSGPRAAGEPPRTTNRSGRRPSEMGHTHARGKLHRHELEVHAQSDTIHYCVCNVNPNIPVEAAHQWAEFIVRACNAHDDLLAACKRTLEWLSSFSMPPTSTIAEKQEHISILEIAIAKSEGREP